MASDRIEELKTVQFPTERRGGYDRRAVDAYLAELADWLETGGEDEARRAVIRRAMSDVGDRTGSILASAQESADELTSEAQAEADRIRAEAGREAAKLRSDAEDDAAKARSDADSYATGTRSAADEHARITAETAAAEAKALIDEAEARLKKAEAEAEERTRGIEQEIAGLVRKRRDVVANLEQLNAEMRLAIEGPGERDLDLSERVAAAVESPDVLGEEEGAADEEETEPVAVDEAPTTVSGIVDQPGGDPDIDPDTDERPGPDTDERPDPDTEERERRRRSVDSVDPSTEDTKLTELL
jgi:DivIVA domain-containing protein